MVDHATRADVLRAIKEYDRLGPERFFSEHGFAPTTTYELAWEGRRYPTKASLRTAYEFATGERLGSGDFEGGKSGAVRVLGQLGFTVQEKRRTSQGKRTPSRGRFYSTLLQPLNLWGVHHENPNCSSDHRRFVSRRYAVCSGAQSGL